MPVHIGRFLKHRSYYQSLYPPLGEKRIEVFVSDGFELLVLRLSTRPHTHILTVLAPSIDIAFRHGLGAVHELRRRIHDCSAVPAFTLVVFGQPVAAGVCAPHQLELRWPRSI